MRLKRIELHDDFGSLKSGFSLDFIKEPPRDNSAIEPYCVVGRNGSGKSNILELLSAIFYQVEIQHLNFLPKEIDPPYVDNKKQKYISNKEHEYVDNREYKELKIFQEFTKNSKYKIKPEKYKLQYYITNQNNDEILVTIERKPKKDIMVSIEDNTGQSLYLLADDVKEYLPSYILGYSSGQNEILSLPFYKMRLIQHDEYLDDYLAKDIRFKNPESRMIYLDDVFSQAIFITNFIYGDEKVNKVFKETIGVKSVESFRIVIKDDIDTRVVVEVKEKGKKGTQLKERSRFLKDQIAEQIEKLKSCATMDYRNEKTKDLSLDYYLDDNLKEAFTLQFGIGKEGRLTLFQTFQTLINLNYYHVDVETKKKLYESKSLFAKGYLPQASWNKRFFTFKNFMLKKKGLDEPVYSKSLSDGEYQFLHSIGLALIYRDTQSLFLLDEPETHFNPSWRAEYMSVLRKCFSSKEDEKAYAKAEFLITSHSPFIVSDTRREKVLIFSKDLEDGSVDCKRPEFNTLGTSVNLITMNIFDETNTIGKFAQEVLKEYKKKLRKSKNKKEVLEELESIIGRSIETMEFFKK
ncbi:restriction system-associated AAA family ATPase [Arcobacter sp. LA11]|uniref:restriction system-associated AAA family ATPase n=1 Tax=Arcobacter sp. LA11 TaxID=1898176 RepID=UPI00093466C2|nr:restriction system-associated AAA family ATPase [Arcobacter sp. LA11]